MDGHNHLSEMRSGFSIPDPVRNLGFSLLAPINTNALSDVEVELWWQFNASQDYMFSDFERGNREGWIARFKDMRHLHLDIGGDGYAILLNAWCCDTPEIHFCMWNPDRPFSLTMAAGRELFNFVFGQMKATRIGAFIPETHALPIKFANMMGFRFEGCIRKAFRFYNQAIDVHAYGLLREEWLQRQERLSHAKQQY